MSITNVVGRPGKPWAPRNGLVAAFWSREAVATSGTWYGRLGTALNGTMTGNAAVTAGTGLALTGTKDSGYCALPAGATVKGLSAATLACWYKPTAAPGTNAALWWESTTSDGYGRWCLFHLTTGSTLAGMRDTDTGSAFTVAGGALTNGAWVHLAMTVDSVTDVLQLYVNGVGQTSNTSAKGAFTSGTAADALAIGAQAQLVHQYPVNGSIDNVFLWSRALSAAELAEVMQRSMRK